jgi:AraC-like DNA-binding protein
MTEMGRSAGLTGFADLARSLGLDPYRLAAKAGVPVSALTSPDLKIPAASVGRLLERAARAAGVDDFGLRLAEKRRLSNMGPVGLIARDQPTLRKALEVMAQYQWMQSEALSVTIEAASDIAILQIRFRRLGADLARQATELCVGVLCRNIRAIVGETWRPQAVLFRHGRPASDATHRRVFGLMPQFNQDLDGLVLRNAELDAPLAASDPVMAREVERYISLLAPGRSRSVADRVEELIVLLLPTGTCTAQRVSRHLGVDRRTLHRWLAAEGVSFSDILDEKRRELVLFHLGEAQRSLAAISDLAGFASPSSFSHWCRRVLGRSARDHRVSAA